MIRFVFRFVGFCILAAAFVALLYDGTKTLAGSQVYFTKLGDTWNTVHSTSLQLLQPAIERHVSPWLWETVVLNILTAPTSLVLGILGALLILIGRKKKPLIGYGRD
jgi:ABC-type Fe3+ transport system permease subunit